MPNINPGAGKHIFNMATITYRNVAKTLRKAPNTNYMGTSTCYRIETDSVLAVLTGCETGR